MRIAAVGVFVAVTAVSSAFTPRAIRRANDFAWAPMVEVAELFAAIFITIGPVLAMLHAGAAGPFAPAGPPYRECRRTTPSARLFLAHGPAFRLSRQCADLSRLFPAWLAGPRRLTGELADACRRISAGSVFFGGLTYIGNAPNMMIRAHRRASRGPHARVFRLHARGAAPGAAGFVLLTALFFR